MHKKDFINFIRQQHSCSLTAAAEVVEMFTASVTAALKQGETVELVGFGKFSSHKVPARTGHHPQTKAKIQIKACNSPRFRAGKKMKDACNSSH